MFMRIFTVKEIKLKFSSLFEIIIISMTCTFEMYSQINNYKQQGTKHVLVVVFSHE